MKNNKSFTKEKKVENNGCLIYGKHPFFSVLKTKKRKVNKIYILNKNKNEFYDFINENNVFIDKNIINFVDSKQIDSLFPYSEKNHQGYIMFTGNKPKMDFDDFINENKDKTELPKLIILDQILDPHNLGAIIRTCVAFGIYNIIVTSYNSVKDTPVVAKASVGLNEVANLIEVVNLNYAIKDLKDIGYFVIGLDGEGNTLLNEIKDNKNIALVSGNEGRGIRELVKKNCDVLAKIPMESCAESLNVSVATAISIYEIWGKK